MKVQDFFMSTVPFHLDLLGALPEKYPEFFKAFGNLETKLLSFDIEDIAVERPVFVCGMARSGSTLLIEILAAHPDVATHQYRDFPFLHVNYFWNSLKIFFPSGSRKKVERAHKDGIFVNAQSPESLDEGLWMSFFENLHDPSVRNVLDSGSANPAFAKFYREHLQKLLLLRRGRRFAGKNNYDLSRIRYLKSIFPDALFVVPAREPLSHVYSCLKQHRLISAIQEKDARARRYMRRHGHHEFGLDFAPVNFGSGRTEKIMELWKSGRHAEAYAHYWADTHEHVHALTQDPALSPSLLVLPYETLCGAPAETIERLGAFCGLDMREPAKLWADRIKLPDYYTMDFSAAEIQAIGEITGETAAKLKG